MVSLMSIISSGKNQWKAYHLWNVHHSIRWAMMSIIYKVELFKTEGDWLKDS